MTPIERATSTQGRGRHALWLWLVSLLAIFPLSSSLAGEQAMQPRFDPMPPGLPFSKAVSYGGVLYISGQIGIDPKTGRLAPGGIEAETRQVMESIKAVLAEHDLDMNAIFKCTVMLADMADWPAFNRVYAGYFAPDRLPVRSAFGVSWLAFGARLELECWAAARAGDKGEGRAP